MTLSPQPQQQRQPDDGNRTGDEKSDQSQRSGSTQESSTTTSQRGESGGSESGDKQSDEPTATANDREPGSDEESTTAGEPDEQPPSDATGEEQSQRRDPTSGGNASVPEKETRDETTGGSRMRLPEHESQFNPAEALAQLPAALNGLAGMLKLAFYIVAGLAVLYLAWRHRRELLNAFVDILRQLQALFTRLFGGTPRTKDTGEEDSSPTVPSRRTFSDFRDPFLSGKHQHIAPAELVCYTFEAFEAWSSDHGHPRTPDQTPQELLRSVVDPQSPLYAEARRMVRLYSELAYASGTVSRESAGELRQVWQLMRTAQPLAPLAS